MGQPEDVVRLAYDTVADDYARLLPDTRAEHVADLCMLDTFAELVRTAGVVLDAGCGAGRISRYLTDRGCTVRGVDLSPGMVAAGLLAHPDLDLSVATLADLPFEDATFAGALAWYSTIHTPDAQLSDVLSELVRVVRPGGHLLVGFQAGSGAVDLAESYGRHGHDVVLSRYLRDPDRMSSLLGAAGADEVTRLIRPPEQPWEGEDQAVILARRRPDPPA